MLPLTPSSGAREGVVYPYSLFSPLYKTLYRLQYVHIRHSTRFAFITYKVKDLSYG